MTEVTTPKVRELTGKHVLGAVIAFFVLLFIVNGAFIYAAVGSFRGEDVKGSYRQGLNYNETLAERRDQAALGWTAYVDTPDAQSNTTDTRKLSVQLKDNAGQSIYGAEIKGRLRHPVDSDLDIPVVFMSGQSYVFPNTVSSGRWIFEATAYRGKNQFKFRRDITFK